MVTVPTNPITYKTERFLMKAKRLYENSNRYRRVKRALFGDLTGRIRTFAIISPQNPKGALGSEDEDFRQNFLKYVDNPKEWNKNRLVQLKRELIADRIKATGDTALKYGHFNYVQIKGSYGEKEKSLIIFNLAEADAKVIARDYGQESFFFGHVSNEEDKPSRIAYYKTENHCKTYKLVEITETVTDETDATDFFSKFGFKYRINMREFGDDVPEILNQSEFEESLKETYTFMGRALSRRRAQNDR